MLTEERPVGFAGLGVDALGKLLIGEVVEDVRDHVAASRTGSPKLCESQRATARASASDPQSQPWGPAIASQPLPDLSSQMKIAAIQRGGKRMTVGLMRPPHQTRPG